MNLKPHLKLNKNIGSIGFILTITLIAVLLIEIYLIYFLLYRNVWISDDAIIPNNIVRVDLADYNKTIDLLNELESFSPNPLVLSRPNPFK